MLKKSLIIIGFSILACGTPAIGGPNPTRTPLPTLTPTPSFQRWGAPHIVRAIHAANLEGEDAHPLRVEEYGAIPALAAEGIRFSTPSFCSGCGGLVLSFDDPNDLETTKAYFIETNDPAAPTWVFVKDNILLQLSGQIPEAQALEYGTVLLGLN